MEFVAATRESRAMERGSSAARVVLAVALAGCGDDGGGARDAASDDAAVDGPADDATGDAPSPPKALGMVAAARLPFPDARLQLLAGFVRVPDGAPGCATTTSGACTLTTCPEDAGVIAASAGDITFQVSAQTYVLTPDGANRYDQQLPAMMVTPGTPIGISAAGAEVPAFATAALIELPLALQRTAPADDATFDRTQDLVIAWSATSTGMARVTMGQTTFDSPYPYPYRTAISCQCPASEGSVTIPAGLLGAFAAGSVNASLLAIESSNITAGDFEVRLVVATASTAWTSFTAE